MDFRDCPAICFIWWIK